MSETFPDHYFNISAELESVVEKLRNPDTGDPKLDSAITDIYSRVEQAAWDLDSVIEQLEEMERGDE